LDVEVEVCVRKIKGYYEEMEYQQVVETIFGELVIMRHSYDIRVHRIIVEYFLLMIYPICPFFVESIWEYGAALNFSKNLLI
jgi:hypothetical protein